MLPTVNQECDLITANPLISDRVNWEDNSTDKLGKRDDTDGTNGQRIIPSWLEENPEMIFQPCSIETEEMLGYGQYGTVFRGKLHQNKAV